MFKGEDDYDLFEGYSLVCENILRERKRVGGDWVVAQAVPSRKLRDLIKEKLGPQLMLVVLNLDKELQLERLKPRLETFGEELNEAFVKMKVEPVGDDEQNIVDLKITRDLQIDDVVKIINEKLINKE